MPDRTAVEGPTGRVSYQELSSAVARASAVLTDSGVETGTLIRLHGSLGAPLIAQLLAAWQCGAVVWLDADAGFPAAGPLVDEESLLSVTTGPADQEPGIRWVRQLPADFATAVRRTMARRADLVEAGGGYLVRSSGSTGRRKMILGDLRSLSQFVAWQRAEFRVSTDDRVAALTNIGFDVVYREIFTTLTSGATLLCPPPNLPPSRALGWLWETGATILHVVPSLARYWLTAAGPSQADQAHTPRLRATFFAGEPLDAQLVSGWRFRTGERQEVVNFYGPSETTLAKFSHRVPRGPLTGAVPVGQPLPGTSVAITDPHTSTPVPAGSVGEVVIKTAYGSFGYLGDASPKTLAKFRREGRLVTFHTGDLGRLGPDGLVLLGRLDSQLKINGVWINCHSVETELRAHPAVEDAAVLGQRTSRGLRLHAAVVLLEQVDPQLLRGHVLKRLGPPSVPAVLTPVPGLPRLATGKVDRISLRRLLKHQEQAAAHRMPPAERGEVSRDQIVERVAKAAAELLGTAVEPDHDLVDSGLDLIAAAELCVLLEDEFLVPCTPEDLFAHPVPAHLASLLLARTHTTAEE
ncbi:non-ribosomal peptide synthetase [Streptomyces sp. NPDC058459]|uniref:non-ribosomal peptide synthetase n=1 Tax=Streptomyces sp. NPDC058459 TaxID=3346508 RepID=UPI003651B49A